MKKKRKIKIKTILIIFLDILVITCFFLAYGPINYFRNFLVNTAMRTKTHQYLAYTLYSDKMIQKVLSENYFIPVSEDTDLSDIVIDTKEKTQYANEYEKELLTRDSNSNDYKILNIKIGNSKGYIVAIYNPAKVKLVTSPVFGSKYGEQLVKMCPREGASVCINGGGFEDPTGVGSGTPTGYVIKNGKVIWSRNDKAKDYIIGFTKNNKLSLSYSTGDEAVSNGVRDGLVFGPFLIVNGKSMKVVGDPWGYSPRTAIAQRKDGVVMFLVVDGENYTNGASLKNMIDVLEKYGAYNAANLDGGHSTSLVVNGKLYNNPPSIAKKQNGRYIVTGFGLYLK